MARLKWLMRLFSFVIPPLIFIKLKSLYRLGYVVNVRNPKTFNEKINYRKLQWRHPSFVTCSDKVAVRSYVSNLIGEQYLIPAQLLEYPLTIELVRQILSKEEAVVLKANHNSGPVFLLRTGDSDNFINRATSSLNLQFKQRYGRVSNEGWYNEIKPQLYYEKALLTEDNASPMDFKFHVFNNNSVQKVILQLDYDRFTNHGRTFFNEDLERLPFSVQYPDRRKYIQKPKNYEEMLEIARRLASDFSYVRVDLYSFKEKTYFGELTFASDGGYGRFSDREYDLLLGSWWEGDPRY